MRYDDELQLSCVLSYDTYNNLDMLFINERTVDFFEIGNRGSKYGPLGELLPIQDPPGSGYFECSDLNISLHEFIVEHSYQGN